MLGEAEAEWAAVASLPEEGVVSFVSDNKISPILTGMGKVKNATSVARSGVSNALSKPSASLRLLINDLR